MQPMMTYGPAKRRVARTPRFPIIGTMRPFGLYPLHMQPVLPGETLESYSMRWRAISMPIRHPLVGAWLETWLCYVKFTDLDRNLGNMFISDTFPTTGYTAAAANDRTFVAAGQIDWIGLCLRRIAEFFFYDEGEAIITRDGVPLTKLIQNNWTQNLMFTPASVNPVNLPSDPATQLTGWQVMQQMGMTEMSYEKYLETFGVASINAEVGQPEILRYTRSWTLPTNTIEPTTGSPSSCFAWSDEVKADKPKRFQEPGFLITLAALRPKMYQRNLRRSIVGEMWGFADWFPSYNLTEPGSGIRQIVGNNPVFDAAFLESAAAQNMLYDHRDILSHGEQFVNNWTTNPYPIPMSGGQTGGPGSPRHELQGDYVPDADIDALFLGSTPDRRLAYYEGLVETRVMGHIVDQTPRVQLA